MKRTVKISIGIFFLVAPISFLFGQTLASARQKTEFERYEEAQKEFDQLLQNQTPPLGEVYYFYGDNFFRSNELEEAKKMWAKGKEKDPENNYALLGEGRIDWLNGDTAQANELFNRILANTKRKNAALIRQIANVYINAPIKNLQPAVDLLQIAIKIEPKNQENYLLMGDAQVEINPRNSTEAMKSYNKASDLHNDAKVIVRKAKIYQRAQNPRLADSLYAIAQQIEPNYAPAYRERAELNMRFNQTKQAIQNWEKYLQLNDSQYARYRYATSLFEQQQYQQAIKEIQTIAQQGFSNLYTKRMLVYSIYEQYAQSNDTSDLQTGWSALEKFFETTPKEKIIGYDYRYKALYNKVRGNTDAYLQEMEQAAEFDSTIATEIYTELAKYYLSQKNYEQTIVMYNKKMNGDSSQLSLNEHYDLARAYFFGPKDYEKCDQQHAYIIQLSPDYAMSYLWRGRANVRLDTEKVLYTAKPYYEQFLALITDEQKQTDYKNMTIEAYKFLGDYYFSSPEKDMVKAAEMWTEIQKLEPEDPQAKAFFNSYKKVKN